MVEKYKKRKKNNPPVLNTNRGIHHHQGASFPLCIESPPLMSHQQQGEKISKNPSNIFNFPLGEKQRKHQSTWNVTVLSPTLTPSMLPYQRRRFLPMLSVFSKASWSFRWSDSNGTSLYPLSWSAGAETGSDVWGEISIWVWAFIPIRQRNQQYLKKKIPNLV